MKLKIIHQTYYNYQQPLLYLLQTLHLQPMQTPWQSIIEYRLKTTPNLHLKSMLDLHGNHVHVLNIAAPQYPIFDLTIEMQAIIETQNNHRFDFKIIQDQRLGLQNIKESINPIHYLRSGHLTEANLALTHAAQKFLKLKQLYLKLVKEIAEQGRHYLYDIVQLYDFENELLKFAASICEQIPYQPNYTHSKTSAAEAYHLGVGVCQDHAHIALVLLRALDIPARYVSGYFYDPHHPNMASHAWVDVILPIGFISMDVTHQRFTDEAYIRLAHGFDYQDISLVKGVREGGGIERLQHKVQILGAILEA